MYNNQGFILIVVLLLTYFNCYIEIKDQDTHFNNIHAEDYVLSVFHNPKKNSKLTHTLINTLKILTKAESIEDNKIVVEYIDIVTVPFIGNHYGFEDNNCVKLFVRNQMVNMEDFDGILENVDNTLIQEPDLASKIEQFVLNQLNSISVEIRDLQQLIKLINNKKIAGLYTGLNSTNFKRYLHVAKKNIDFNFAHTFDEKLRYAIYNEFGYQKVPKTDSFAIIRHDTALNEFDDQTVVIFDSFNEKELTEFLEFERFDKLRGPEQSNHIVKRMFFKAQPLLLYVLGSSNESQKFEIFRDTIKTLPKRFIYSYTSIDSVNYGSYLQLFIIAEQLMVPETVSILWISPSRKVKVEAYNGEFTRDRLIDFVFGFHKDHEQTLDSMRMHLYNEDLNFDEHLKNEEL